MALSRSWILLSALLGVALGQYAAYEDVRWCCVGESEHHKCLDFAQAVNISVGITTRLHCIKVWSKDECLHKIDLSEADLVTLDPGEVFLGGRYHSLVPIMTEKYGPTGDTFYYAVAVVKRNSYIRSPFDLRGRSACFPGVGQLAGWVLPIATMLKLGIIPITDCNNHIKSTASFFSDSCAPNALINKNNPTGDNPTSLCARCNTRAGLNKCLDSDLFSNYDGAFRCLAGDRGDVAFLKHTTVREMATLPGSGVNANDFELLCPNGQRASIDQFLNCNWGRVPSHAVVTSSETPPERRRMYQEFIRQAIHLFAFTNRNQQAPPPGGIVPPPFQPEFGRTGQFQLFQSGPSYAGRYNLLFQDTTTAIDAIPENRQTFKDYLGQLEDTIVRLRDCPVESVKFCIVSDMEMEKCYKMRTALKAQFLKPDIVCFRGRSYRDCIVSIAMGNADLTMLDAGDVYVAGKEFGLVPILAEQYNLDGPYYYAVAVSQIDDPTTDLLFVRGKYTCHTSVGSGAGWIMPVGFLLKNERLRSHGCDGVAAASEFFEKSCVPGAMSPEYNRGWKQNNLCDLCRGTGSSFCQRDPSEPFYGYTGAFHCLVEGGGNIAFVKHTTVYENTNGVNSMWWARNMLTDDFQLLCRDGSRARIKDYETCNLGKVPGNAMVARSDNQTIIQFYINLFLYAQQYYGSKAPDDFKFQIFRSHFPYHDLIFQDETQVLVEVPEEKRNYLSYLGLEFVHAVQSVDCTAAASVLNVAVGLVASVVLLHVVL